MTTSLTQTFGNKVSQKIEFPALTAAKSFSLLATATLIAQLAITHFGLAPLLGKAGVVLFTTAFTFGGLAIPHLTLAFGLTALVAYAIYKVAAHHNSKNLTSSFAQLAATQQDTKVSIHQVAESIFPSVFAHFADKQANPFHFHVNFFVPGTKNQWEKSLKDSLKDLYTNPDTQQIRSTQGLKEAVKQAAAKGMVSGFNFDEHQPMLSRQLLVIHAMIELITKRDRSSPVLTSLLVKDINLATEEVAALEAKLLAIVHHSIDAMDKHHLHV